MSNNRSHIRLEPILIGVNKYIAVHCHDNPDAEKVIQSYKNIRYLPEKHIYIIPDSYKEVGALIDHVQKRFWVDTTALRSTEHHFSVPVIKPTQQTKTREPTYSDETAEKIEEMRIYMQQKRYARSTIETYISMVKQFFSHYTDTPWKDITEQHIIQYNHDIYILQGKSYSTQNQGINALKLFFSIHRDSKVVPEQIERPRKQRSLPVILTKEEVSRVLKSTPNLKHRTLLSIIYGSGLRIGEALRLELTDISREEHLLYIRQAKGHKDRRVPISDKQIAKLEEYYYSYTPKKYVFEGQSGGMYSYRSAQQVMKRALRKAGIRKRATLHSLRHSYATHLLEAGVKLRYIQEIMGHSSPKTTMIYTHVSGKRLGEIHSPFDDLEL